MKKGQINSVFWLNSFQTEIQEKKTKKTLKYNYKKKALNLPSLQIKKIKKIDKERYCEDRKQQKEYKSLQIDKNNKHLKGNNFFFSLQKQKVRKCENQFTISTNKTFVGRQLFKKNKTTITNQKDKLDISQHIQNKESTVKTQQRKANKMLNIYKTFCNNSLENQNQNQPSLVKIRYAKLNQLIKTSTIQIKSDRTNKQKTKFQWKHINKNHQPQINKNSFTFSKGQFTPWKEIMGLWDISTYGLQKKN